MEEQRSKCLPSTRVLSAVGQRTQTILTATTNNTHLYYMHSIQLIVLIIRALAPPRPIPSRERQDSTNLQSQPITRPDQPPMTPIATTRYRYQLTPKQTNNSDTQPQPCIEAETPREILSSFIAPKVYISLHNYKASEYKYKYNARPKHSPPINTAYPQVQSNHPQTTTTNTLPAHSPATSTSTMYISAPLHTPFPPSYPHAHAPAHVSLRRRLVAALKEFAQRRLPPRLARLVPRSGTSHANNNAYYTTPEVPPERGRAGAPGTETGTGRRG
ncbi:uncharacterized protein LAJ45_06724 [Morchella importuna]|uniref:uncharacterized protein n=1 Tax=Morchella importuna TaxID=1174673 RepID=UPI001E8EE7E9|nr:uncharacterized protein LAJ45_06724 [Morchella importuna]KAH8149185.1 hypothetical protein LAJ45_06724 [Morchella importuna]